MKLIIEIEPQIRQVGPGTFVKHISKKISFGQSTQPLSPESLTRAKEDSAILTELAERVLGVLSEKCYQDTPHR